MGGKVGRILGDRNETGQLGRRLIARVTIDLSATGFRFQFTFRLWERCVHNIRSSSLSDVVAMKYTNYYFDKSIYFSYLLVTNSNLTIGST